MNFYSFCTRFVIVFLCTVSSAGYAQEILNNKDFSDNLASWKRAGQAKIQQVDGDTVVELNGNEAVTQKFDFPENFSGMVELSAKVKTSGNDKIRLRIVVSGTGSKYAQPQGTDGGYTVYKTRVPVSIANKGNRVWCGWSKLQNPAYIKEISLKILKDYKETEPANTAHVSNVQTVDVGQLRVSLWAVEKNDIGALLQRRSSPDEDWKLVAELSQYLDYYIDRDVKPNSSYYYRVKYLSNGGHSDWSSAYKVNTPSWFYSPGDTTYYVDPKQGSDKGTGQSPEDAWKTLDFFKNAMFAPGDRILFKSGGQWEGNLELRGEGTSDKPIFLSVYGGNKRATIKAKNSVYCVRLKNSEHWNIADLELINRQPLPEVKEPITVRGVQVKHGDPCYAGYVRKEFKTGFLLELSNYGTASGITIQRLYIHDVEGTQLNKDNGGIVVKVFGGLTPSRFEGLHILDNKIEDVTRSGIVFVVIPHYQRTKWFPSKNVLIEGNELRRIGGDGITPWACDGAVIQKNIVSFSGYRARNPNAGIWPWSCDNTLIQYNTVCNTVKYHGNTDGQGFDIDSNCQNTIIQYNLSYNNQGGMILICDQSQRDVDSKIEYLTSNAYIRYNVSVDDSLSWATLWADVRDIYFYNNTVISRDAAKLSYLMACWGHPTSWNGQEQENIKVFNNVFYLDGVTSIRNKQKNWVFTDNVFSGNSGQILKGILSDITVLEPEFEGSLRAKFAPGFENQFKIRNGSLMSDKGSNYSDRFRVSVDYAGNPIPRSGKISPGAFQVTH